MPKGALSTARTGCIVHHACVPYTLALMKLGLSGRGTSVPAVIDQTQWVRLSSCPPPGCSYVDSVTYFILSISMQLPIPLQQLLVLYTMLLLYLMRQLHWH